MLSILLASIVSLAAAAGSGCPADAAIRTAVQDTLGPDARVSIETLTCEIQPGAIVDTAVVEPGARVGGAVRFRLLQAGRPVGQAVAVPRATVRHARAARPIAPGASLGDEDVEESASALDGVLLERLPVREDLLGQTTIRSVEEGEILTGRIVRVPPAVRSGERVVIKVVLNGVEARGVATAQQSGGIGDVIRLVNPETRRQLRGRIVGKNEVEVFHGS